MYRKKIELDEETQKAVNDTAKEIAINFFVMGLFVGAILAKFLL